MAIELEDTINVLEGHKQSLEEDIVLRSKLIDTLKGFLEKQIQQKQTTENKLQVI